MNTPKSIILALLKLLRLLFFLARLVLVSVLIFFYTFSFIIGNLLLVIFSVGGAIFDAEPISLYDVRFSFLPLFVTSFIINRLRVINLGKYHIVVPLIIIIISILVNILLRLVLRPEEFSLFPLLSDF